MHQIETPLGQVKVTTLQFESIATPHAISTRKGGQSHGFLQSANIAEGLGDSSSVVAVNRKLICAASNLDGRHFACMEQMHSDAIAVVGSNTKPIDDAIAIGGIDALICNKPDITLMAQSADCPLLLLYDADAHALAVVHSGWRSTLANIASKTIQRMVDEFHCKPQHIQAGISPCICQKHYDVGADVSNQFIKTYPALPPERYLSPGGAGKHGLDLTAIITWQLETTGVEQIEAANLCTQERADLFYSHRRDKGCTGRFGLFAQLW